MKKLDCFLILVVAATIVLAAVHQRKLPATMSQTAIVISPQPATKPRPWVYNVPRPDAKVGPVVSEIDQAEHSAAKGLSEILAEASERAGQGLQAALEWAAQLPDPAERREALKIICFKIGETDPAQAVKEAKQYALDQGDGAVLENLTQQWATKDISGAYDWAMTQAAGEQRDEILSRVAFVWSQSEPENAARFVAGQLPPGLVQTEAAISVVHQWALRDLAGASAWVDQFPDGPIRERAINELAGIARYQIALGQTQ